MSKATEPKHRFVESRCYIPDYNAFPVDALNQAIYDMVGDEVRRGRMQLLPSTRAGGVPQVCFATESSDRILLAPLDAVMSDALRAADGATHPEDIAYVEYLRGILRSCRKKWHQPISAKRSAKIG